MYTLKEESDLLNGNGTSPNLLGYLNKGGIQTQAKGADPVPDCIYKLFTKLRGGSNAGFVEPTAVIIHPNDWQDVRLLRDSNGNYIWGSPADAGPERIWGKPLIVTTAIAENTALTGDFQLFSQIWRKRGARVEAGMQNDDFVKLKMTLRVYGRLVLVIYRAAAYGTATGI
jgi:HK97 family phage major capsid protein